MLFRSYHKTSEVAESVSFRTLDEGFKSKVFNISFTQESLETGAKLSEMTKEAYIQHCKDLFSKSRILALHDIDKSQTNSRQEIRFILWDLGYVFFCMTRAGKDFGCFRVMKINDINEVKNIHRAFELNCTFEIESKDKTLANANELKQFLKSDFEKYKTNENFAEVIYDTTANKTLDRKLTITRLRQTFLIIVSMFGNSKNIDDSIKKDLQQYCLDEKFSYREWLNWLQYSNELSDDEFIKEVECYYKQFQEWLKLCDRLEKADKHNISIDKLLYLIIQNDNRIFPHSANATQIGKKIELIKTHSYDSFHINFADGELVASARFLGANRFFIYLFKSCLMMDLRLK